MAVAGLIFGLVILSFSLFFLLLYVNSNKSLREQHGALARQREQQLKKFQADLQARMDAEEREFEAARQALLNPRAGGDDPDHGNIEHAA